MIVPEEVPLEHYTNSVANLELFIIGGLVVSIFLFIFYLYTRDKSIKWIYRSVLSFSLVALFVRAILIKLFGTYILWFILFIIASIYFNIALYFTIMNLFKEHKFSEFGDNTDNPRDDTESKDL